MRSPDGELKAIGERERLELAEQTDELLLDEIQHVAHLQRLRRVLDVLRRRAVVKELRREAADDLLKCAEQRHQGVARLGDACSDRLTVEKLELGRACDAVGRFVRDHLHLGLTERQRGLDVEPTLHSAEIAEHSTAVGGGVASPVERIVDDVTTLVRARRRLHPVPVIHHQASCASVLRITRPGRSPVSLPSFMT